MDTYQQIEVCIEMARKSFTQEQIAEILKAEKEATMKYETKRLLILRLRAVENMSSKEISQIVGYNPATINNIISKYFKNDVNSMLGENRKGGNKRYLSEVEENELLRPFEESAKSGQMLLPSEIQTAYEKRIGKSVPKSTLYRMLKRQCWRKIMPRSKHPKSKPEEFGAYKKNQ